MQASATPHTLQRWQALGTSCAVVRKDIGNESSDHTKPQDQQWVSVSTNRKPVSCEKENKKRKMETWKKLKMFMVRRTVYLSLFQSGYNGKCFEH